ncbi:hypothetical protein HDV62DRAFT_51889 [Trichoderma sp. SZMC 28011]
MPGHPSHGWCRMYTSKRGASCGVTLFPALQSQRTKRRFAVILWLRRIKRLCGSFSCLACSSQSLCVTRHPSVVHQTGSLRAKAVDHTTQTGDDRKKNEPVFPPTKRQAFFLLLKRQTPDANESSHSATKLPDANAPLDDPYHQRSMTPNQNAEAAFVPIF